MIILLSDPVEANDNILINIDKNGEKIEVPSFKKRNPYTLQFPVPGKNYKRTCVDNIYFKLKFKDF